MKEIYERGFVACTEEDRITNLPEHLIHSILEWLPFEDIVRTSIISKTWRYIWTTMRELVFDMYFSRKFAKNGAFGRNGFIRIINQVLFLHKGPILKFHLHIPYILLDSLQEVLDQWMLLLSRKGVRELVLTNSDRPYQLSSNVFPCLELTSNVFSCLELTKLQLENCFFKPSLELQGFLNLKKLCLECIDFEANLCGTHFNFPQLKELFLDSCMDVYNLNIKAKKLQSLTIIVCSDVMLLQLLDSQCIIDLHIYRSFKTPIKGLVPVQRINLPNLPRIELLSIDGGSLEDFIGEKIPKWLPHPVKSLKCLDFHDIQLRELCELHGVLCLLRNSPNVESLRMILWQKYPGVDEGPASNHLEVPHCLDCTLNQLQIVEITCLEGSRLEMLFIKLLLAHSPSLKEFTITPHGACDVDICKDVMQFPRASPKAEIIYLNPPRKNFVKMFNGIAV